MFCSFSTANLAFWWSLSRRLHTVPLPVPSHDNKNALDPANVYVTFETNEGDTPRILTSQFTSAWLSPRRGSFPLSWAVDPLLGKMFPELWNFFMSNATKNDTFLAGVDGGGYIYVDSLGSHAEAYEKRVGALLEEVGPAVVDVGVPQLGWPAVELQRIRKYIKNARSGGRAPDLVMNACASDWGEPINAWLQQEDGTGTVVSGQVGKAERRSIYLA